MSLIMRRQEKKNKCMPEQRENEWALGLAFTENMFCPLMSTDQSSIRIYTNETNTN